jgi:DNA primase
VIPNSVRDEVRARIDLAELVGQYVPLRRSGNSMVARCPFHQEKTPSFHVSRDRGLFYCFGCKAAGDVFTFYERIEGVTFPEALRALAEKAGVEIVEEQRDPARVAEERRAKELTERLYHACEVAAAFWEHCLEHADLSEIAREELARRNIGAEMRAQFRLGYAPAAWDALAEHLRNKGVSPSDAEIAGLLVPGRRGYYDRFRHRLMCPVWDRHGKIVAFSGRILPVTETIEEGIVPEETGKYINTPETPIFKKSDHLFGLQAARNAMRQRAEAILVEGNFDVVAMHQAGFPHTVAPLGTAFTDAQARLLRRFAETVTIVFDADEAGRKAARAAHVACARAGIVACVAILPRDKGKDPDEVLRAPGGREALADRIKYAPAIVEWLIQDAAARAGDTTPARVAALREVAPALLQVPDRLEREAYMQAAARALHLEIRHVDLAIREAAQAARADAHNPFHPRAAAPRPPRDEPFRRGGESERPERPESVSTATADAIDALLRTPALLATEATDELLTLLDPTFAQPLVAEARRQWLSRGELDGPALLALAPNDKARAWVSERLVPAAEDDQAKNERNKQALNDCVARLHRLRDRESARNLEQESARASAAGDVETAARLWRQAQLIKHRHDAGAKKNRGAA